MPLGVVKHLIVTLNPDGPICDAMEEIPTKLSLQNFLWIFYPDMAYFQ